MKMDKPSTSRSTIPILKGMNLKAQLRFYLDLREMSAAHLAKKSSVPKQSISGWLAGSNPRDIRQVKRVADVFGITVDHLMFGKGQDSDAAKVKGLEALMGDDWLGGLFEIRIRRVKK